MRHQGSSMKKAHVLEPLSGRVRQATLDGVRQTRKDASWRRIVNNPGGVC